MKGYLVNTLAVAGGSLLGLLGRDRLPENLKDGVFTVLGLVTLFLGVKMSLNGVDLIAIVVCLVLGTLLGTLLRLEERTENVLGRLTRPGLSGRQDLQGFLTASTLFCVGSMTIIGSLKDGLSGDGTLIRTKSVLDGFASLLLASRYGLPVLFSAITVFVVQGALTLFSSGLTLLTAPRIMNDIDGAGGIIVMGIGLNLMGIRTVRTADMLPALLLIVLFGLAVG